MPTPAPIHAEPTMADMSFIAPVEGLVSALKTVPDPAFSSESLGPGFAIEPLGNTICAPCAGEVIGLARTLHAITLRAENGAEILIHIGLETVVLGGKGFVPLIAVGEKVDPGTALVRFDINSVALGAKSLITPVILLNSESFRWVDAPEAGFIEHGRPLTKIAPVEASASANKGATLHSVAGALAEGVVIIEMADGIHARPAAQIAKLAKTFKGEVSFSAGLASANGKSVASLMGLGVAHGESVTIKIKGEGSEAFLAEITNLIRNGAGDEIVPVESDEAGDTPKAPLRYASVPGQFQGVAVSAGMVLGPIYVHKPFEMDIPDAKGSAQDEQAQLDAALKQLQGDIHKEAVQARGQQAALLEAHGELADDPILIEPAQRFIIEGKSAGQAWRAAIGEQAKILRASGDKRIAERTADLKDLETRVLKILYGDVEIHDVAAIKGAIVIADDLMPSEFMFYAKAGLSGLALASGGATSHVSILAAAENIPALVALGDELLHIAPGTKAMIHSGQARLVLNPADDLIKDLEVKRKRRQDANAKAALEALEPASTQDGQRIHVFANLASVDEASSVIRHGAEGCGLLRTEFLFTNRRTAPNEDEQEEVYAAISECLKRQPVVIRTMDIGSDKPVPFLDLGDEENPALGLRGVRTFFVRPDLMKAQVRALLRASRQRDIQIMVPMVASPQELIDFRAVVREEADDLGISSLPAIGTMIETPASAVIAEQIAQVADFFSIGTNDLTQYTLAMDRGHAALAGQLDAMHPAVLGMIARVGEVGQKTHTPVSVCGGLASDPLAVPILIGMGITKLSVVESMIAPTKAIIRSLKTEDCQAAAKTVQTLMSAKDVRAHIAAQWPDLDRWL